MTDLDAPTREPAAQILALAETMAATGWPPETVLEVMDELITDYKQGKPILVLTEPKPPGHRRRG